MGSDAGRLFPDTPLPLAALRQLDAEIQLKAGVVKLSQAFSVNELRLAARAEGGRLELTPLEGKLADGTANLAPGAGRPAVAGGDVDRPGRRPARLRPAAARPRHQRRHRRDGSTCAPT
ncbi:MAG: hypothetical protein U5L06_11675 [Rhodovibrio sp.]|nr:hypothetical protein [Rhodovibrio sp.]